MIPAAEDGSFHLNLTVPLAIIKKEADQHFKGFCSKLRLRGFRPGRVPPKIARQHYPEVEVVESIFPKIISCIYTEEVQKLNLRPVIPPRVKILNKPLTLNKDWKLELTSCQLPQIKLAADLADQIKKLNHSSKRKTDKSEHLNLMIETIVKSSQLRLPAILITHELENRLSRLVDQLNQASLTVNQYLSSKNITLEQYRQGLQTQIWQDWCLNLAIHALADTQNLHPPTPGS